MKPQPPPALHAPEAAPLTPEQVKKQQHERQLRISYAHTFSGLHGAAVLKDLKARFGWDGDIERPTYLPGMDHARTAHTDGMKEPVRHILAMIRPPENEPQPKPTTASS